MDTKPVALHLVNEQIVSVSCESAMSMIMHYYPKAAIKLMEKAIKKAQLDHKLDMGSNYQMTFNNEEKNGG